MDKGDRSKFGTDDKGWCTRTLSRPHGKGMWKKICMGGTNSRPVLNGGWAR